MGWDPMRITADTNILVRAAVLDDPHQGALASNLLRDGELIAVTLPALCEFARVLGRGYRWGATEILGFITSLLASRACGSTAPQRRPGWRCWKRAATSPTGSSPSTAAGSAAKSSPASTARRLISSRRRAATCICLEPLRIKFV